MGLLTSRPVSKTLRTEVKEILHRAIVSGKLQPGDHLKETEIAEQLSVSRSPVREALNVLTANGFVEQLPRRGYAARVFIVLLIGAQLNAAVQREFAAGDRVELEMADLQHARYSAVSGGTQEGTAAPAP